MREIVFDTETTGFDAKGADRITEIGCIEVIDLLPTGRQFHTYLDPQRDVPPRVTEITGLTTEFLKGKPLFKDKAQEFLDFIGDDMLIAHNARFDMGFINAELERAQLTPLPVNRFKDTLAMANAMFPGSPASLDALCRRFDISLSARDKHGAIVDSELLAAVYLELSGGRERRLGLNTKATVAPQTYSKPNPAKQRDVALTYSFTAEEKENHLAFVSSLGDSSVWKKVWRKSERANR